MKLHTQRMCQSHFNSVNSTFYYAMYCQLNQTESDSTYIVPHLFCTAKNFILHYDPDPLYVDLTWHLDLDGALVS